MTRFEKVCISDPWIMRVAPTFLGGQGATVTYPATLDQADPGGLAQSAVVQTPEMLPLQADLYTCLREQVCISVMLLLNYHACVHMCVCVLSSVQLGLQPTRLLGPWRFSGQEYWSGLPFPPPESLPDPGITPKSLVSSVLAGRFFTNEPPRKPNYHAQAATNQYPYIVGFLWLWLILHLNVPKVLKCQNQRWC